MRGRWAIAVAAGALVAAAVGARSWAGHGFVEPGAANICALWSDEPVYVGAAVVANSGPAARIDGIDLLGAEGITLAEQTWVAPLDVGGSTAFGVGSSTVPGAIVIPAGGLAVAPGESWSIGAVVEVASAGGHVDGFVVRWSRGPFEFRTRSVVQLDVPPSGTACGT